MCIRDRYGTCVPNYHYEDLARLWELYQKRGLSFPAVVVDANHSNSDKKFREQPRICLLYTSRCV